MHAIALAVMLSLSAAPKPAKTQLKIEVKPAATVVYVDGKRKGTGAKLITLVTTPGRHHIRLVNGKDEHQDVVSLKQGETKKWTWAFEDDRPAPRQPSAEGEMEDEGEGGEQPGNDPDDDGPPVDDM
jgi:hypothetical protein